MTEAAELGSLCNHGTTAAGRGRQSPQVHHLFFSRDLRCLHMVISSVQHRSWLKRTCLYLPSVWLQQCLSVGRSSQKEATQLVRLGQDPTNTLSLGWPQLEVIWARGSIFSLKGHQSIKLLLSVWTAPWCSNAWRNYCVGQREEARISTKKVCGMRSLL